MIDGKIALSQIRSLSVEDLLARAPVGLDPAPLKHLIGGRRVHGDRRRRIDRLRAVPADCAGSSRPRW